MIFDSLCNKQKEREISLLILTVLLTPALLLAPQSVYDISLGPDLVRVPNKLYAATLEELSIGR